MFCGAMNLIRREEDMIMWDLTLAEKKKKPHQTLHWRKDSLVHMYLFMSESYKNYFILNIFNFNCL